MFETIVLILLVAGFAVYHFGKANREELIKQWLQKRGLVLMSCKRDWNTFIDDNQGIEQTGTNHFVDRAPTAEVYDIKAQTTDKRGYYTGSARVRRIAGQYTVTVVWDGQAPAALATPNALPQEDINRAAEAHIEWLRQNPHELQRYDMDGNGVLDAEEWERLRFLVRDQIKSGANLPSQPVDRSW